MLGDTQKAEADAALDQICRLTLEDLETLDAATASGHVLTKEARSLLKFSAADSSWLEKRVREASAPLLPLLQGTMIWWSWVETLSMVKAVLRRDRLTVEQYEAFVRGPRAVGWVVPRHPSPEGLVWADSKARLPETLRRDVKDFLAQVARMTEADYETTRDLKYAAFVEHKATMYLPMMPAADFRWLVDQVRTTLNPAAGDAPPDPKETFMRTRQVLRAVQQIVCREKMTSQQYEALMARYRAAGVQVPAYSGHEG